ncbi:outer membrane transport energization protein ExbD [Volucribacter psittacicida]|uniref:Outer membrane transport energization protein ExbD n=1 Tax=Volucribacter psittacicida TaxID=203482 RepID=A0A4V6NCU9_9PAST|nr:biopolymer transporter ExbD [Volucribacter psittacicida]TCK01686.1 outer membrane transport energization protein ExbD [Volucribacter psittacicida]
MALKIQNDDQQEEMSEINVTPFIDVMLVLLIIFMATIPLATVHIPLDLPAVTTESTQDNTQPVILSLNNQNELFLGNDLITMENLMQDVENATKGNKETVIFFRIDKEVKYELLMQLMNSLRKGGYLKIGLVGLNDNAVSQ